MGCGVPRAGNLFKNGAAGGGIAGFHPGDVITVILDLDADQLSFEINGVLQAGSITGLKSSAPLFPGFFFSGSGERSIKLLTGTWRAACGQ